MDYLKKFGDYVKDIYSVKKKKKKNELVTLNKTGNSDLLFFM